MIYLIPVIIGGLFIFMLYRQKKQLSKAAIAKWDIDDETVYVEYGKYKLPLLMSQLPQWEAMNKKEKWVICENLENAVIGGKIQKVVEDGFTKYLITTKGKDIKHWANKRLNPEL